VIIPAEGEDDSSEDDEDEDEDESEDDETDNETTITDDEMHLIEEAVAVKSLTKTRLNRRSPRNPR